VPAVLVRDPNDPRREGWLALIGPPIFGQHGDDARVIMQQVMSWLEGIICRYPDQWFMFRNMWPTTVNTSAPD
jgi:lauroyl/myristoyl acyltransferase